MSLFKKHENADAAIIYLLKSLGINVDDELITAELDKHPDYPSLLAVSDVLTALNIENSAFRIGIEDLPQVPCPFMAHTKNEGGELVVVSRMDDKFVYLSTERWKKQKLTLEEFNQIFEHVVLTVEPPENFTATAAAAPLSALKTPALAIGIVLILGLALSYHTGYFASLSWQLLALTLFKTAGLVTAILLLVQSIDTNNPLVQVLCQTTGKTNCNAILSSKAAKVFDGLSWSEVGFFYFAGTWLFLLFGGNSAASWQALAILNVVSLPYTVYSIYYQARVAKQWCVLCCTVQALLWLEFIPLISRSSFSLAAGWADTWSALVICLLTPVIFWMILKPMLLKIQQLPVLKSQLRKFKYNGELFNKLLKEQPRYALPDESWCIVLGNVEANNIITMVTNPYCPPCAKTHKLLEELLHQRGDVQARIVFTATNSDNDYKTPVARHMMALNDQADKATLRKAMDDWYEQKQKSYEIWAQTYPVELKESEFYKIDRQSTWCKIAEVNATPTLLLNGHRLPELYQLTDLKYMLE